MASVSNDPCRWNNECSVSSYWTRLLDMLQHEARHLVVVLQRGKQHMSQISDSLLARVCSVSSLAKVNDGITNYPQSYYFLTDFNNDDGYS